MRWSKFSDVSEIRLSYQLAGKRVRPVFYYAYAPRIHSHGTGSGRQLKRSCRLGHSLFREAKTTKKVEEFSGFPQILKFWQTFLRHYMQFLAPSSSFWSPLKIFTGGGWRRTPASPASTPLNAYMSLLLFSIVIKSVTRKGAELGHWCSYHVVTSSVHLKVNKQQKMESIYFMQ